MVCMKTVGELSALAGVTVRTLHHYDELGLLVPGGRSEAGYRLYSDADLGRLQDILGWRALGFSLQEAGGLVRALGRRISAIEVGNEQEEARFDGLDATAYEEEARERWGDTGAYRESARRTARYGEALPVGRERRPKALSAIGSAHCQAAGRALPGRLGEAWDARHSGGAAPFLAHGGGKVDHVFGPPGILCPTLRPASERGPGPGAQPSAMTPPLPTFLDLLATAERDALLAAGHVRRWPAGEVLFREGDAAASALLIICGLVKVHKHARDGDELILSLSGPGDLLGEVSLARAATRSADASALRDVEAVSVPVADLRALLARQPRIALALLELALARLRLADQRRLEFASAESLPRVTSRLLELAERFGVAAEDGTLAVEMPISQEELASWAAASRESTARALRTLRELGLIETHRKRLVVLDAEGLHRHASRV